MNNSKPSGSGFERIGRDIHYALRDALREVNKTKIRKKIDIPMKRSRNRQPRESWQEFQASNEKEGVLVRTDAHGDPIAPFKGRSVAYQVIGYFIGLPLLITSTYTTVLMLSQPVLSLPFVGLLLGNLLGLYPATYFSVRTGITGIKLHYARQRFSSYWQALKERGFAPMQKLAREAGRNILNVRNEIRFMVKQGFFDKAHIDREHDMLVINEPNYVAHKKAMLLETQKRQELEAPKEALPEPKAQEDSARAMIREGKAYIEEIEAIRSGIKDPQMQQDLVQLEKVTYNIFSCISKNPEKLNKIRRFMQYYLPTTVKLVQSYEELEAQPVAGVNIQTSKDKIKESMKTINTAFERLLDELFQKDALDIHSDLIAMETMMARDGLGGKDFIRIREEDADDGPQ